MTLGKLGIWNKSVKKRPYSNGPLYESLTITDCPLYGNLLFVFFQKIEPITPWSYTRTYTYTHIHQYPLYVFYTFTDNERYILPIHIGYDIIIPAFCTLCYDACWASGSCVLTEMSVSGLACRSPAYHISHRNVTSRTLIYRDIGFWPALEVSISSFFSGDRLASRAIANADSSPSRIFIYSVSV